MTITSTTINEGPRHDTPLRNLHSLSTPSSSSSSSEVIDLDLVSLLFVSETELSCVGLVFLSSEEMTKVCRLYVGIVTALALCKYSLAEWNATDESANRTVSHCRHHGNGNNCTDTSDTGQGDSGHFSKCPKELKSYCVHGECRYIKEQNAPSCRCEPGYNGSRCQYLDLDWQIGEKRQIIIACVIAGLILLILLIVFICICSHRRFRLSWRRRRRRREEPPRNGTEKLNMMDTGTAQEPLTTETTEAMHTNTV